MLFRIGLTLLFFLPVVESFDRRLGLALLLFGSLFISLPYFEKKKIRFDMLEFIFLAMLIIFSVSTIFSRSVVRSYTELTRYTAYFLVFITFRRFEDKEKLIKRFFIPVVIINSIILSVLFLLYLIPFISLPPPTTSMNLFYPTFRHDRISDILILAIPLALGFTPFLPAFFITMLFMSMGLGAIISLVFAFLIYAFLHHRLERKMNKKWEIIISLFGMIAIIFVLSSFIFSNFIFKGNIKEGFLKGFIKPLGTELRGDYIRQAVDGFRLSPILGTGLDAFRYVSAMYQTKPNANSWYAHNQYIQQFSDTGILGGSVFIILIILLLMKSYRNLKNTKIGQAGSFYKSIFIALIASGILACLDYNLQYLSIFLFWWMGIALLLPAEKPHAKNLLNLPFFVFIIILFSYQIFLLPESENEMKKADKYLKNNMTYEAIDTLERMQQLDKYNELIVGKLAELAKENNNQDEAHKWNQYAVLLQPLDASDHIKDDYLLYLDQSEQALRNNDFTSAYRYIDYGLKFYPPYHHMIDGNEYFNRINILLTKKDKKGAISVMRDYIVKMKQKIKKAKLSVTETRMINDQLKKNGRFIY